MIIVREGGLYAGAGNRPIHTLVAALDNVEGECFRSRGGAPVRRIPPTGPRGTLAPATVTFTQSARRCAQQPPIESDQPSAPPFWEPQPAAIPVGGLRKREERCAPPHEAGDRGRVGGA